MFTFDLEKLKKLFQDFYLLTKMKVSFFDADENELFYYPQKLSSFCAELRKYPENDKKCLECDKKAFKKCKETKSTVTYTCHAGIYECFSPIIYNDEIIGYITLCQARKENTPFYANKFDLSKYVDLENKYYELPEINQALYDASINILKTCARYEHIKTLFDVNQSTLDIKIEKYINENLNSDLSVSKICSEFNISWRELYTTFDKYFHCTVAKFIKKQRLKKACDLLLTTTLPVSKICVKCGIEDYNYFSKIFQKEFKISPREYRNKNSKK